MNKIKKLTQRQEGFTIIEVMIVLVIAAVILLIVFLAVPALQRNSRNTQRKNEVSALLAGANEFETNNSGTPPTAWQTSGQLSTGTVGSATGNAVAVKTSFYAPATDISVGTAGTAVTNSGSTQVAVGKVVLYSGVTCAANGTDSTTSGASSRQIVALYSIESSSNANGVGVCQAG